MFCNWVKLPTRPLKLIYVRTIYPSTKPRETNGWLGKKLWLSRSFSTDNGPFPFLFFFNLKKYIILLSIIHFPSHFNLQGQLLLAITLTELNLLFLEGDLGTYFGSKEEDDIALHSLWSLYRCLTGMHEKYVKKLSPKAIGPKDMLHNFIFNNTRSAAKNRGKNKLNTLIRILLKYWIFL